MTTSPSIDPLRVYLEQISRHPLLTASEEARLARAAENGDSSARRRLVECNLRLVVAIARRSPRPGVELLDLVQEGNIGLMTAAERFDWRRGVRFATYAGWWIRSAMRQAGAVGGSLRLPDRVLEAVVRVRDAERELEQRLRRSPTRTEIARESGLSEDAVDIAKQAGRPAVSLHEPIYDGLSVEDLVADPAAEGLTTDLVADEDLAALAAALDALDERPRRVVALRFGLEDDEPATLTDIAGRLRLSRERVRQLESRALRSLARDPALRAGSLAA